MPHQHPHGFDAAATKSRLTSTWLKTIFGITLISVLAVSALMYFGLSFTWGVVLLGAWSLVPAFSWYHSGTLVLKLMKCREPNAHNPDHQRLVRLVDELYPLTGLKVKPPVYISPVPMPNAFATGRNPANSFIAATEGLLHIGLTDAELKAVLAHELAHVKCRDVSIGSFMAVMGSLFAIVLSAGLPGLFRGVFSGGEAPLLDKLSDKVNKDKKRFFTPDGGVAGFITMLLLFYVISMFTKFLALFVSRCRESAADVLAAQWTNDPCALSTALQKIRNFMLRQRRDIRLITLTRGMKPLFIVNAFDEDDESGVDNSLGARLGRWWRGLGEHHPSVEKRIAELDAMSGGQCPRVRDR